MNDRPDWERLLAAERHVQHLLPDAVLVGAQLSGAPPLAEVVERLAEATPTDSPAVDLATYKGLVPPWNEWSHVSGRGRHWARVLARVLLDPGDTGE